jgi:hypothetical protein
MIELRPIPPSSYGTVAGGHSKARSTSFTEALPTSAKT